MNSSVSIPLHTKPPKTQLETALPYEITLMIFKYCDLPSLKALRLASKPWALVGLNALLLLTLTISPSRPDITRLLKISHHPLLSPIASSTIKNLNFISNDWDLSEFRNIFSNRVESNSVIMPNSFVPTEEERLALDELDLYEANLHVTWRDGEMESLVMGLKAVPNYHTITISSTCIFTHRLLKKTWAEYAPSLCISPHPHPPQILTILTAITSARIPPPKALIIEELDASFALSLPSNFGESMKPALKDLESLEVRIEDMGANCMDGNSGHVYRMLTSLLSTPKLKSLSLCIASTSSWTPFILPSPLLYPQLKSLSLSQAAINGAEFLSYLAPLKPTLTHLQLLGMRITSGEMRWKEFLTGLREVLVLERFCLARSVWFELGSGEQVDMWHLQPHCDREWKLYEKGEGSKSWGLEKFVTENGEWPMTEADDVSRLDTTESINYYVANS